MASRRSGRWWKAWMWWTRCTPDMAESAGGGMRGGKQDRIFAEGNTHLDRDFPKLDRLIRARVE